MDLREYFGDVKRIDAELRGKNPDGVVHVTSRFHRERNSTPGTTLSATTRNAARVIADGTHELATAEEVAAFVSHQEDERIRTARSEQTKNKQYIVVLDNDQQGGIKANASLVASPTAAAVPGAAVVKSRANN